MTKKKQQDANEPEVIKISKLTNEQLEEIKKELNNWVPVLEIEKPNFEFTAKVADFLGGSTACLYYDGPRLEFGNKKYKVTMVEVEE